MRVEWAKSKARDDQWQEERLLVVEEMCRVISFLEWKAEWWISQGSRRCDTASLQRGLLAYAMKQASISRRMAQSFASTWYPELVKEGITVEWPQEYVPANPGVDMTVD